MGREYWGDIRGKFWCCQVCEFCSHGCNDVCWRGRSECGVRSSRLNSCRGPQHYRQNELAFNVTHEERIAAVPEKLEKDELTFIAILIYALV